MNIMAGFGSRSNMAVVSGMNMSSSKGCLAGIGSGSWSMAGVGSGAGVNSGMNSREYFCQTNEDIFPPFPFQLAPPSGHD